MRCVLPFVAVLLAGFAPVPLPRASKTDYQKWADAAVWPTWPESARTSVDIGGIVYHVDFSRYASGCSLVAMKELARRPLWRVALKGLGPIAHSKYFNAVHLEPLGAEALAVYGNESAGRYVEVVSLRTGKTLGHKVFPR